MKYVLALMMVATSTALDIKIAGPLGQSISTVCVGTTVTLLAGGCGEESDIYFVDRLSRTGCMSLGEWDGQLTPSGGGCKQVAVTGNGFVQIDYLDDTTWVMYVVGDGDLGVLWKGTRSGVTSAGRYDRILGCSRPHYVDVSPTFRRPDSSPTWRIDTPSGGRVEIEGWTVTYMVREVGMYTVTCTPNEPFLPAQTSFMGVGSSSDLQSIVTDIDRETHDIRADSGDRIAVYAATENGYAWNKIYWYTPEGQRHAVGVTSGQWACDSLEVLTPGDANNNGQPDCIVRAIFRSQYQDKATYWITNGLTMTTDKRTATYTNTRTPVQPCDTDLGGRLAIVEDDPLINSPILAGWIADAEVISSISVSQWSTYTGPCLQCEQLFSVAALIACEVMTADPPTSMVGFNKTLNAVARFVDNEHAECNTVDCTDMLETGLREAIE